MVNGGAAGNVLLAMVAAAHTTSVLACATSVALVFSVPVFAQSNNYTSGTAVRQYIPAVHIDTEHASPPPNFIVPADFRPIVAVMLRRSHTFRRQCQRIANAPHVTIELRRSISHMPIGVRARTQIVRPSGRLSAAIEVPALDDDVELIAHELEHVIEQLDDIDLATAARRANTGVVASGVDQLQFETIRAIRVGLLVVQEVRRTDR